MQTLLRLWRTLEACPWSGAVVAEWDEHFGAEAARLRPHLKPTGALAATYPCPHGGGDGCPRQVHDRGGGAFEAVCGNVPAECSPLRLKKADLAVHAVDRRAALEPVVARVREQNALAATSVAGFDGLLPLGILERRVGRTLVVLANTEAADQRGAILELRRIVATDAVAVLVEMRGDDRVVGDGHVELALGTQGDLALWRALQLQWPESWAARATRKEAVFEDVRLEFAAESDKHLVLLNGQVLKDFRISDTKFARLLRLAVARWADPDVQDGGWLKKAPHLQLDEREADLVDLRNAFIADQPDGFAGMTVAERKALVQSSTDRPGLLRLPLNPRHIRFDPSLKDVRLLGDQQNEPRAPAAGKSKGQRKTSGSDELARNKTQARAKALKMFGEARKLGVPLPEESVLKSRPTET